MKASWNWLASRVDLSGVAPKEAADKLTFAGVEVDGISRISSATNLVIGEIVECEKHPDSDHLHVLKVDEGPKYGIHQIVCGAPNARKGLKVIVAREGAVLPEVTIKKSVIRGVESDGMCCALYELGVDKKYLSEKQCAGIEELPEDAKVGDEDVLSYLGLDDTVLDLDLLANRSDLYALNNVAYELSAVLDRPLKKQPAEKGGKAKKAKTSFKVSSATAKCPIFLSRVVRGVKVAPSPRWLSDFLRSEGVRSINNVVDVGNYVMLVTGQPLNMYDYSKLPEESLSVVDDYEGDFVAMDGNTYKLVKGDLLVTSGGRGMCLAGIMTSKECEVTPESKDIVIEAAYFDGASIRHTSNRLGLASESSSRFVKGINPEGQKEALDLAASLLDSLCGADAIEDEASYDVYDHKQKTIDVTLGYINSRLGTSFSMDEVVSALKRDHMGVERKGDSLRVTPPSFRIDMDGAADVSEEAIRLLGYENVPSKLPQVDLYSGLTYEQKARRGVRSYLRAVGLSEVLTYTLVKEDEANRFDYLSGAKALRLKNPMTVDHEYVRKGLLPSLLSCASFNVSHGSRDAAIFELSDIDAEGYEASHLGGALIGLSRERGYLDSRPYDFFDAKGLVYAVLSVLGINEKRVRLERLKDNGKGEFHPGRSACLYVGKELIAVFGELHPEALRHYGLGKSGVAFEIKLSSLLSLKTGAPKASAPSRFPSIYRDLAFVVGKGVSYDEIKREISRVDKLVREVDVFDIFEGKGIGEGKKSVAVSLVFYSEERTLKDEEVAEAMNRIVAALKKSFQAEVRQ
jgi:phenylalanyl-tRNA synthetase beta chain